METRTSKHRRVPNPNPNPVEFIHLRYMTPDAHLIATGGGTIAYRDSVKTPGYIEAAFARCSFQDTFCKKIGRDVAVGHLDFERCYIFAKENDRRVLERKLVDFYNERFNPRTKDDDSPAN